MGHFDPSAHSFIPQGNDDQDYVGSVPFTYIKKNSKPSPLYQMSINNFLAETVKFFLQDGKMNSFVSKEESAWKIFSSQKSYYLDISIRKDPSLVMIEAFTSSFTLEQSTQPTIAVKSKTMNGRYFGYPVEMTGSSIGRNKHTIHHDPAYAPYTPPYFEGEAIARIKFTPATTKKYTLEQILQDAEVVDIFDELSTKIHTGSAAFRNKMPVASSISLFGATRLKELEYSGLSLGSVLSRPKTVKDSSDTTKNAWIIGPKMEMPVLDFSAQPIVQKTRRLLARCWIR